MDKDLRNQLDQIQKKLDELNYGDQRRPKASPWKRLSIAIPVFVAIIGVLGTGYELGLRFLENQNNRKTIKFYTTLAKDLVENGNYNAAKVYLSQAEKIDASNDDVVSTKAFIDMVDVIARSVRAGDERLTDAVENLKLLNLRPEELHYHIATVAIQEDKLDVAEENLLKIEARPERFSLRGRSKLLREVYIQSLRSGELLNRTADDLTGNTLDVLNSLIRDMAVFDRDSRLAGSLIENIYAFGYQLIFLLSPENLPALKESYATLEPVNEEFIATLESKLETDPEKVLTNLYAARKKSRKTSPVNEPVEEAIAQYSAQALLEEKAPAAQGSDYEALRQEGVTLRHAGNFDEAEKIFLEIINAYKTNNLGPDQTLYKTYFNLALINEYGLRNPPAAVPFYEKAERLAVDLGLEDPSIHNTFGFLYYKLGRDTREPDIKEKFLILAREKLQAALAIDPKYARSLGTLEAVKTEFEKIRQVEYYQKQVEELPTQRAQR